MVCASLRLPDSYLSSRLEGFLVDGNGAPDWRVAQNAAFMEVMAGLYMIAEVDSLCLPSAYVARDLSSNHALGEPASG